VNDVVPIFTVRTLQARTSSKLAGDRHSTS
jgi:hypothetical protein